MAFEPVKTRDLELRGQNERSPVDDRASVKASLPEAYFSAFWK